MKCHNCGRPIRLGWLHTADDTRCGDLTATAGPANLRPTVERCIGQVRKALGLIESEAMTVGLHAAASELREALRWLDTSGVRMDTSLQPTPYGLAGIEGDAIVIRLTADACAFAFTNDPRAQEPRPPVIDKQQFLRDTLNELTAEREDGSTPLTDVLDRAMVKAMENGSDALDHDAADGVKGSE